ncbi:MAG: DUF4230 domain-containing protein [Chthoniobacterales bacterium]
MNEPNSRPVRKFSWALAFTLIFLLIAFIGAFVFWRIETWPMRNARAGSAELERLASKARDAFIELAQLQPRVTIHDRVYFEQTSAVAELAVLSRQTEVDHEFMHTWAGSTKRIKLHGTFHIKAGFDLRENLTVDVRESEVVVELPHAKILTVEQQQVDVLEFENGYWNRISAADLEKEFAALSALARAKAAQSDLLVEAETTLRQQLESRLGQEHPVRLAFPPANAVKP